jgi:hypothetical protein
VKSKDEMSIRPMAECLLLTASGYLVVDRTAKACFPIMCVGHVGKRYGDVLHQQ